MKETLRWSSVGLRRRKMDFEFKNASDLIASVPHGPKVQTVTSLFRIIKPKRSVLSTKKVTYIRNAIINQPFILIRARFFFLNLPMLTSECMWALKLCVCVLCAG